ncbi:ERGIC1 [Bugula neritina]|uniref:ERGIC1 n=1 Tax=Bugula neritina TaxID=10212 RepID=A0A7J7JDE1_BUGNE|nr:ERGIC1 [Bugula neritina]
MQHSIEYIIFGDEVLATGIPGSFNPLKNVTKINGVEALATHDYFLKLVPSSVEMLGGDTQYPYQYSYAYRNYLAYGHGGQVMPALWFRYDLSPITVAYTEKRQPFYHFLTMFCAIIGGTFTVASIIDSMIFTTHNWFKKAEIGKLG